MRRPEDDWERNLADKIEHLINNLIIEIYKRARAEIPSEKQFYEGTIKALKKELVETRREWFKKKREERERKRKDS